VNCSIPHRPVVLVVEDEPLLLMVAMDTVTDAGFEAIGADNAGQAIRILENRNDVSVLFSDVNMPGSMNGLKLAQVVQRRWPPIGIILTSAFYIGDVEDLPDGGRFFQKPYDPAAIGAVIQELTV
jgi:CheY-like chemotaxis protein